MAISVIPICAAFIVVLKTANESCMSLHHGWCKKRYGPGRGAPMTLRCSAHLEQVVRVLEISPIANRSLSSSSKSDIVRHATVTPTACLKLMWYALTSITTGSLATPFSIGVTIISTVSSDTLTVWHRLVLIKCVSPVLSTHSMLKQLAGLSGRRIDNTVTSSSCQGPEAFAA
jgi:hypothetical protein